MHATYWVRLYREGQVLMHPSIGPPNAASVGFVAVVRLVAVLAAQTPSAVVVLVDAGFSCSPRAGFVFVEAPTPHVVAGGNYARANAFGTPCANNKVADASGDTHQTVFFDAELFGIAGV